MIRRLGSAISWLTFNMNANYKDKYDKIHKKMENLYHIVHNGHERISLNEKLARELNKDIKILNYCI